MKRYIFCYLILFPFAGNSQQPLFNKTYSNSTGARAVIERADGNFLIAGTSLMLIDSTGNLIWQKPSVFSGVLSRLIETRDHHYILSGSVKNAPYVLKLDIGGNEIWNKEFQGGDSAKEFAYTIGETFDNNYYFVSSGKIDIDSCSILYKINPNGDTLWTKHFKNAFLNSVVQTIDSGFILAGIARNANWNYNFIVIKTNGKGELIFVHNFGYETEQYTIAFPLPDGGCIVSGGYDYRYGESSLIKLNATGGIIWMKFFFGGIPNCISQCIDGSFVVSTIMAFGPGSSQEITKVDKSGNVKWQRHFKGGRSRPPSNDLCQTRDGGFVLTGYNQYGIFLVKLDSSGNYVLSVNDINKPATLLSVYPNPADDEITFNLNSGNRNLISEITIYNTCGQVVKHIDKLAESNFKWSVNDLDPGIYFYNLKTDNQQVIHGKFFLK